MEELKTISEIVKNGLEIAVLVCGLFALIKWLRERGDRATDVLFRLEEMFHEPEMEQARALVEDEDEYAKVSEELREAVSHQGPKVEGKSRRRTKPKPNSNLDRIDKLLRFYVVIYGVRAAHQVPDLALRTCYRYWLAHYFHPGRIEFRQYIDAFFPTLNKWLQRDQRAYRVVLGVDFFRPGDFGFHA